MDALYCDLSNPTVKETADDMSARIKRIEESIGSINRVLEALVDKLDRDHKTTNEGVSKMTEHIDFIDALYDRVRNPLNFVLLQVSRISGQERKCLTDYKRSPETKKEDTVD